MADESLRKWMRDMYPRITAHLRRDEEYKQEVQGSSYELEAGGA